MPQPPDADEDLVGGQVVGGGRDAVGVEVVLGVGEDVDGGGGQADEVLEPGVRGGGEQVAVEGRLGAEEVFLDAEGGFVGADEGDDEDWVGLAAGWCELG